MGCLYKLTSPSGKSYIGITIRQLDLRWKEHVRYSRRLIKCPLYNAMRKYGAEKFTCAVLIEESNWNKLCDHERKAIVEHNTLAPNGYNLTLGGEGVLGSIPSKATRIKMSRSQKLLLLQEDYKKKKLDALARAVRIRRDRWYSRSTDERAAWGKRHSALLKKAHLKPDSRRKKSAITIKLWSDPAIRERITSAMTGCKRMPWTKKRKDEAAELRRIEWSNPVMREKRLAGYAAYQERRRRSRVTNEQSEIKQTH